MHAAQKTLPIGVDACGAQTLLIGVDACGAQNQWNLSKIFVPGQVFTRGNQLSTTSVAFAAKLAVLFLYLNYTFMVGVYKLEA